MNTMLVSPAPHTHDKITTQRIMLDVIIALTPALAMAYWAFGSRTLLVTGVCVISCVFFEWAFQKLTKKKCTIKDLSAVLTGILLAYCLPVNIPIWQAIFGCLVAIVLVKQLFGGLGKNFANPAVTARIVMYLAFPLTMITWKLPFDPISGTNDFLPEIMDLFLGLDGCSVTIGDASAAALVLGGLYLLIRRVITWHAPVAFIGTVFALTAAFGAYPVHQILYGGLFLAAIFMATDYTTTPLTNSGRFIFGLGAGLIAVLIRLYGNFPEGAAYGILFMNMLVPYINKFTAKKALGQSGGSQA